MGELGDRRAVPICWRRLNRKTRGIEVQPSVALGQMGIVEVFESIIELLGHDDGRLRADAAFALGTLGDPRAVPHLAAALERKTSFTGVRGGGSTGPRETAEA